MASYVVMEPETRTDDPVFVRDGFSILAFLMPFLWFLWHRMWIEALAALAAALALGALGTVEGYAVFSSVLSFCLSIFFGLEAGGFRVAALKRRGFSPWGVIEAGDRAEAELRYGVEQAETRQEAAPAPLPELPPFKAGGAKADGPALGLLSYPGTN